MIKQYFTQAWAQLRQQPMISTVTITGTALAIFLIMLVVMVQQVQVVPFAPESNRDRFLHVKWMSIANKEWGDGTSNGPMSVRTAQECFQSLKRPKQSPSMPARQNPPPSVCRDNPPPEWICCRRMTRFGGYSISRSRQASPTTKRRLTPEFPWQ